MSEIKKRGPDRRIIDIGPTRGMDDRRKSPERRMPHVGHLEISQEEFMELFGGRIKNKTIIKANIGI